MKVFNILNHQGYVSQNCLVILYYTNTPAAVVVIKNKQTANIN